MKTVKIKAYAKINLSLNIKGVENDYHMIDSIVASVDIADVIVLRSRKDKLLNVYMKGLGFETLPPHLNNAVKAGELFLERFNTCGADITIYKNIPAKAGLGGSSADAAGVIKGLAKMYGIDDREAVFELACQCGSDTPYMLEGGFARLKGRGEIVEKIQTDLSLRLLLLLPKSGVSTKDCYAEYDKEPDDPLRDDSQKAGDALVQKDLTLLGGSMYNALERAAIKLNPDVGGALAVLRGFSPLGAAMTGSGSCVYALFENDQYTQWAASRYRGRFDCRECKTVIPSKEKGLKNPYSL